MIVKHGGKSYDTSNGEEQLDRKSLADPGAGDPATLDRWADDGAASGRPFKPRNRVAREASRVKAMAARLLAVRRFLQIAYVGTVGEMRTVAAPVPKAGVEFFGGRDAPIGCGKEGRILPERVGTHVAAEAESLVNRDNFKWRAKFATITPFWRRRGRLFGS